MPPKCAAALKGSPPVQHRAVKRLAQSDIELGIDGYREKRKRNNIAVKKSRAKSRARAHMTTTKVEELRRENSELEGRINVLSKELDLLKDLLVLRAGTNCDEIGSGAATSEEAAVTDSSTTGHSCTAAADHTAAADPDLIRQDHGYVSPIHRTRKHR